MDTDTFNMVGSYRSQTEALRVVAEAARRYGKNSPEARSLVLYRQDCPVEEGFVAEGADLVNRALAAPPSVKDRLAGAVRGLSTRNVTGSHRPDMVARGLAAAARSSAKTSVRRAKRAASTVAGRATKVYGTKDHAVNAARKLASKSAELVIHGRDGRERTDRTVVKSSSESPGKRHR
jgi:hypothetical protein